MSAPKDPIKYATWIKRLRESHLGYKVKEETKQKIGAAHKGRKISEEHKQKISRARKGKVVIGKEQLEAMSKYRKEHPLPKEHYERLSVLFKGRVSPMKGRHHSEETKNKISAWSKQRRHSVETKLKMSEGKRGDKGTNWKGGISFEPYCPKFNDEFKERVRAFFGYQCIECGTPQNGKKHNVHHINFNKMACCAGDVEPLFVPLCQSCHSKTGHNREYWEAHFTDIIKTYYQGKCFLSREEFERLVII